MRFITDTGLILANAIRRWQGNTFPSCDLSPPEARSGKNESGNTFPGEGGQVGF